MPVAFPGTTAARLRKRVARGDAADAPKDISQSPVAGDASRYKVGDLMSEVYVVTELIVTPEMRANYEARCRKTHLLGDELHGSGVGELDLGEISGKEPLSPPRLQVAESQVLQIYMRNVRGIRLLMDLPGPIAITLVRIEKQDA